VRRRFWVVKAGEEEREVRKSLAGGQELQPWDWKSSRRVTGMGALRGLVVVAVVDVDVDVDVDDEGGAIWAARSEGVGKGFDVWVWKGFVKTLRRDFMVDDFGGNGLG